MKRPLIGLTVLCAAIALFLFRAPAVAQQALAIPIAEMKLNELPAGELFWRVETFLTQDQARAAAGRDSLVAETPGKVWLFTLGPSGGTVSPGATRVGEFGPIARVPAAQYRLMITAASGPAGVPQAQGEPGSQVFYLVPELQGVTRITVGPPEAEQAADSTASQGASKPADVHSLVMFVMIDPAAISY